MTRRHDLLRGGGGPRPLEGGRLGARGGLDFVTGEELDWIVDDGPVGGIAHREDDDVPVSAYGEDLVFVGDLDGMSLRTAGSTSSVVRSTPRTRNWRSSIIVIVLDSTKPSSIRL